MLLANGPESRSHGARAHTQLLESGDTRVQAIKRRPLFASTLYHDPVLAVAAHNRGKSAM
ncbi:hypothetical protein TSOC_004257 [Tetrabaena socialis]|uniref:Uncharacterized protein n=1 Tax=Tetrabaena socialis TaxID=47790 RepID=A0A2J8A9F8_9CHLO|nr:hypothetical protein TSOC_004257 [Tetrabaena socialis]|eukprot:PNH09135.1 hypothetical protein TSOC_004257 [Tetrabaena socialis]